MHYVGFVENPDVIFTFVFIELMYVVNVCSIADKFFWLCDTDDAIVAWRRLKSNLSCLLKRIYS